MVKTIVILLFIIWSAATCPAFGADRPDGKTHVLDTVVVTARGRDSLISATPGGVGAIGAEEIVYRHPPALADMAARISGVSKANDSPWGADVNIRGLGRNRMIVLIDGCRVNTGTDINAQFGLIDPMEVERVEVLKGPISALYGSGSIGGVVNIITRQTDFTQSPQWEGAASTSGSTNPSGYGLYGNIARTDAGQWVYASVGRRDYDSYKDGNGNRVPNSRFDDVSGKIQLSRQWNDKHRSRIQFQRYQANEVGIPGSGTANLPVNSDVTYPDLSRTLVNMNHDIDFDARRLTASRLNAYFQRVDRNVRIDRFTGGPIAEIRPEATHDTMGAVWRNHLEMGSHQLAAGIDVWNWEYEGTRTRRFADGRTIVDMPLADSSQLSAGVFAEDDWRITDRVTVNAGLRVDHIAAESEDLYQSVSPPGDLIRAGEKETDISWNAHAGLTWQFLSDWSMALIAASSYRAPDLLDRFKYIYFSADSELYGNPDLEPERSVFVETGIHYQRPGLGASVAGFYNEVSDMIADPSPSGGIRQLENIDKARIYGMEADCRWLLNMDWSIYGNLAFARGRDVENRRELAAVPPLNGLAGIRWDDGRRFWSSLEAEWAAEQHRTPADVERTDSWAVINLAAGYRFAAGDARHDLVFRVDNLTDAGYRNYLSTSRGFILKEPGINAVLIWMTAF
jgi:hemoglobin/transferrin/lactoferrin receptor protein